MPEQFFKEIRETTCAATEMCTGEFFSSIAGIPVTAVTVRTESASAN
jgi:hypothetical protein